MLRKPVVCLLLAALLVSSCSGDAGSKASKNLPQKTVVKIAFWGSPVEIDIIKNSTKEWEAQHPEIEVRFEHTPFGGYTSKILTRIAGGAAPDIIATEVNMFVSFASKGVLENLSPYLAKDTDFSIKDFFPEVVDWFTVDGKVLAIPRDTAPFACVFYNKDLFDREGVPYPEDDWTWEDMLAKAKALTKTDENGRITQYGFYGWAWQNFVYGAGGALVDDVKNPTKCLLGNPESKEGLQFYVDLINRYKVMPTPVAMANLGMGVDIMFSSGRLAMFLSGIWETPTLRTRKFRWDVAMFPVGPRGVRRFGTGGTGYAILKSSKNKEAAWLVVKALTGARGQEELAEKGLAQPARKAVSEGPAFAKNDGLPLNKKMLNEAVQYARYDPFHPMWRELEGKVITPELELLFNGRETVPEAMDKLVPEIDDALSQKSANGK